MDYNKHYDRLITRAKNRSLDVGYYETHHILPKCLGGDDSRSNLVKLTPEEHYVAHQLLVKIYEKVAKPGQVAKLLHALNLMSGKSNINRNNKYYGWIRRRVSESRKGYKPTQETLDLISTNVRKFFATNGHHHKGRTLPEEQKNKIRESLKGRIITDSHRSKISASLKGKSKSPEHRSKFVGKNNPSYKHVNERLVSDIINDYKNGISILDISDYYCLGTNKILKILIENEIDPNKRTCTHCGKTGQTSNMLRWHFGKCKYKDSNINA